MKTTSNDLRPGSIVTGPTLPEPIEVLATVPMGFSLKVIGRGRSTGLTHDPVLTPAQIAQLPVSADRDTPGTRICANPERFRAITELALGGLAQKELNLSAMVGKSAEAKERRLVPEVVEQFFVGAAPECRLRPKETGKGKHVYRVGKVPRNLLPIGDSQEDRFGRLAREYKQVVFDKTRLRDDPTLEWVTPGHPLFEVVRTDVIRRTEDHLSRGAVFFDLHREKPALIDFFAASIKDGRGRCLHRRLFAVESLMEKGDSAKIKGVYGSRNPKVFPEDPLPPFSRSQYHQVSVIGEDERRCGMDYNRIMAARHRNGKPSCCTRSGKDRIFGPSSLSSARELGRFAPTSR